MLLSEEITCAYPGHVRQLELVRLGPSLILASQEDSLLRQTLHAGRGHRQCQGQKRHTLYAAAAWIREDSFDHCDTDTCFEYLPDLSPQCTVTHRASEKSFE